MKVNDVILEYKLTHHEIMALFDVIEKQRYMPSDRAVDKAKSKWGAIKKDLGDIIKPNPQNKDHLKSYPKNTQRVEPTYSESINEAGLKDTLKKAVKWGAREINPEMPTISSEQLIRIWKERGSPNNSDEIIHMLVHDVQMPRKMVLNALKKASSEQPNVKAFANLVKKAGIEKQILQYCDVLLDKRSLSGDEERALKKNHHNYYSRRFPEHGTRYDTLNNSVQNLNNAITEEATIKDSDIKDLFIKLAQTHPKLASVPTIKNTEEEIKKWADNIKKTEDAVVKMNLVKDIVNYLADIKGTDDWKKVVSGVENIIRNDKTIQDYVKATTDTKDNQFLNIAINNIKSGAKMEKRNFLVVNTFLSESGIEWYNLGVKPDLIAGDIVLKPVISGTSVFVEDFVKVVATRRIDEQVKKLGRCKKV